MSKWIKNTGVKPNVGGRTYEVQFRGDTDEVFGGDCDIELDWSIEGVDGDIMAWRFVDEKPTEKTLTQAEVQQLLHELRDTLSMVTEIKNEYKIESSRLWELSDKESCESQGHFEDFCLIRKFYLEHKKREQRLVGLITKLKGLK